MTRAQARRRKQRKARVQRIVAWTIILAIELAITAAPTALLAVLLIPIANAHRAYPGIGGEWVLIMLVFCIVFKAIHERTCDRIYGEEER